MAENCGVYRSMLRWNIRVRSIRANEAVAVVAQELATMTCQMITELEDLGPRLSQQMDTALASGEPARVELAFTLAAPDTSRLLALTKSALT